MGAEVVDATDEGYAGFGHSRFDIALVARFRYPPVERSVGGDTEVRHGFFFGFGGDDAADLSVFAAESCEDMPLPCRGRSRVVPWRCRLLGGSFR